MKIIAAMSCECFEVNTYGIEFLFLLIFQSKPISKLVSMLHCSILFFFSSEIYYELMLLGFSFSTNCLLLLLQFSSVPIYIGRIDWRIELLSFVRCRFQVFFCNKSNYRNTTSCIAIEFTIMMYNLLFIIGLLKCSFQTY